MIRISLISNGWIGCTGSGSVAKMGSGNFNPGTKTFTWNNLYSFSDFTGNGNGTPLPISLLNFDAHLNLNNVDITWTTVTETNNDFFTIQRSFDGVHFQDLETMKGAGNSNTTLNYNSKDISPLNGVSYYRLKQTDYDGKFSYSDIRVVNINGNISSSTGVYIHHDNTGNYVLKTNFKTAGTYQIIITDAKGSIVANKNAINIADGNQNANLNLIDLPFGIYFMQLIGNNEIYKIKFIAE